MKTAPLGPVQASIKARQENQNLRADRRIAAHPAGARRAPPVRVVVHSANTSPALSAGSPRPHGLACNAQALNLREAELVFALSAFASAAGVDREGYSPQQQEHADQLVEELERVREDLLRVEEAQARRAATPSRPRANSASPVHPLLEEY